MKESEKNKITTITKDVIISEGNKGLPITHRPKVSFPKPIKKELYERKN